MGKSPNFLNGNPNANREKMSKRHEKQVAKSMGGIETIGSGAKGMKGDVWAGEEGRRLMVENKATEKKSMSLKLRWLEKLVKEAFEAGREPVLAIRFDAMKYGGRKDWAVLPLDRLEELLELEAEVQREGNSKNG